MSDTPQKTPMQVWRRRVVIVGILLGLVCKSLPPEYQGPCHQIAQICTGGML